MQEDGTLESESKKQASRLKREMKKIKTNLQGIRKMARLPGAVVVVDAKKEYLALREAKKLNIPTIALIDTDSDPDIVDVAIPANDDSIRAIELILNELANAVAVGKTMVHVRQEPTPRAKRARPIRHALVRADDSKSENATQVKQTENVEPVSQDVDPQRQEPSKGSKSK
jgi:small subunit ribosomal protein S2